MATRPEDTTCDKLLNATDVKNLLEVNYREACSIVKELVGELLAKNYRVVSSKKVPMSYVLERYHMKSEVKM